EGESRPLLDSKDAEYVVDVEGAQPAPGFAEQLIGMSPGEQKTFTLALPEDYRDQERAGKPAEFQVSLHSVKERELPEVDDEFAQQVGEYTDVAGLRTAVESQLRTREEERVREQLEQAAMTKLVEISSIEFPPQLLEHQAQHMLETFTRNMERQGLQMAQYLRLVGKERDTFEQEMRTQAESRIRRSLALDAFADAEKIGEQHPTSEAEAESRETRALARLVELATGDGRNGGESSQKRGEKTAERRKTSDTETQ